KEEVICYSPTLADRLAARTSQGLDKVVDQLLEVIAPDQSTWTAGAPRLGFLDDLWTDPVSIKVAMNSLVSGVEIVAVDWPESTNALIRTAGSVVKELESYRQPGSRFSDSPADWVASAYEMGNDLLREAECIQRNVSARTPLLWAGMRAYWGNIPSPSFEKALSNFLALANLTIQLRLALFVSANFPDKRALISPHLKNCLTITWAHPRQVF